MTTYQTIKGITFNTIPILMDIGIFYFILTFNLSKLLRFFERRMKKHA